MVRKPNYNFERMERGRAKKEKLAAKAKSRSDEKARQEIDGSPLPSDDGLAQPEADPAD